MNIYYTGGARMHKNTIVCSAVDAHKGRKAGGKRAFVPEATAWVRALIMVIAMGALILAGCSDDTTIALTVNSPSVTVTTATSAMVSLTASRVGKLFWVVYVDDTDAPVDAAALIADAGKAKSAPIVDNSGSSGETISEAGKTVTVSIDGLTEVTNYDFYAVVQDAAGNSSALSDKLDISIADMTPPAIVSNLTATVISTTSIKLAWTNPDPAADDLKQISIRWTTVNDLTRTVGGDAVNEPMEGGPGTFTVTDLRTNENYRFSLVSIDDDDNRSSAATIDQAL